MDDEKCSGVKNSFDNSLKRKMDSENYRIPLSTSLPDRLKLLYPNVNEEETVLPKQWSSEKCNAILLTQNNLRVHYKGFYFLQNSNIK